MCTFLLNGTCLYFPNTPHSHCTYLLKRISVSVQPQSYDMLEWGKSLTYKSKYQPFNLALFFHFFISLYIFQEYHYHYLHNRTYAFSRALYLCLVLAFLVLPWHVLMCPLGCFSALLVFSHLGNTKEENVMFFFNFAGPEWVEASLLVSTIWIFSAQ